MSDAAAGPTIRPRIGRWHVAADGAVTLVGTHCRDCGETTFPDRRICPRCRSEATEERRLAGPARLHSATVVHQVERGMAGPMTVGYGELEEGVLVLAPIDHDEPPEAGTLLDLHVGITGVDENGEPMTTYRFRARPVRRGGA